MQQKIKNSIRATLLIPFFFLCGSEIVVAQKADTLATLRDFIAISNGYKQLPLYLQLEMRTSSNYISSEADTTSVTGEFYLRNDNSYIHLGEFEQVVNDSMALIISDNIQQMILFVDAGLTVKAMKSMMGAGLPDSSIRALSDNYVSFKAERSNEPSMIGLQTRALVYGTDLPKETIELRYDMSNKMPHQVITRTRKLFRLDADQYSRLQNEKGVSEKLIVLEGRYFLIKELVTEYLYKKIEHPAEMTVPVTMSDRIIKNEAGDFVPVTKYASYTVTRNE